MAILVTGGAGFVGSHIVEKLLHKGEEVVVLDNFEPYYDINIKENNVKPFLENKNFKLIKGDIRDRKLIVKILTDIDRIFHFAAQGGIRFSVKNPEKTHDINVNGTFNILNCSLKAEVEKITFASSSSVYGKVEYLPFDDDHPKRPISPYAVSKLAGEEYCRVFNEIYGLKTTVIRPFTVYGPRMRPDLAVSIFTKRALKNDPIEILGDGSFTRDFTYIDDVVDASLKAMSKGEGEIFNIGFGSRTRTEELAKKVVEITGSQSPIVYLDRVKGDVTHTQANPDKAKKYIGWEPKIDIDTGLKKYVDWVTR